MEINIENPSQLLSHLLLEDIVVADKVRDTEAFQKDRKVTATVQMNGVEVPAEVMESVLQKLFEQVQCHYRNQYDADAFDRRVEEKAKQILQEHADNALEKLHNLTMVLEDPEHLIVPHWERKSQPVKP